MKYRKKPLEVEAIQWTGKNVEEIKKFGGDNVLLIDKGGGNIYLHVKTLEGVLRVPHNFWVIKGIHGEFYPCDNKVFEETYEKVED